MGSLVDVHCSHWEFVSQTECHMRGCVPCSRRVKVVTLMLYFSLYFNYRFEIGAFLVGDKSVSTVTYIAEVLLQCDDDVAP